MLPDLEKTSQNNMNQTFPNCCLFLNHDSDFSPIIDPISVVRKNSRQNVAGSLNMKIPTITAPTAPIPVQTG